jgi:acetyl esterase/lipase
MRIILMILLILFTEMAKGQDTLSLYDGRIPLLKKGSTLPEEKLLIRPARAPFVVNTVHPNLTVWAPKKPNGVAVIICPGGGYSGLAIEHEGHEIAKEFNKYNITAFVLKYRSPSKIYETKHLVPLMDLQQAMNIVQKNAKKWKIDPSKIGVLGSSAGGHLAASLLILDHLTLIENKEGFNLKPAFGILNYPVISMKDSIVNEGSRYNLIGDEDSTNRSVSNQELKDLFSIEDHVSSNTPPTFISTALDDKSVPYENSLAFITACNEHGVKVASHFYAKGGHGFGLVNKQSKVRWFPKAVDFIVGLYKNK